MCTNKETLKQGYSLLSGKTGKKPAYIEPFKNFFYTRNFCCKGMCHFKTRQGRELSLRKTLFSLPEQTGKDLLRKKLI